MKKSFVLLAVGLAAAIPLFAGGGAQGGAAGKTTRVGAKGSLPLTKTPVIFTVYNMGTFEDADSFTYKDNAFTRKVKDETGISFEFVSAQAGSNEQFNAMMSSGNYTDIVMGFNMDQVTMNYWAGQGIFISLDDYDIKSFPNIKEALETYPKLEQICRAADGKLHALPRMNECLHCNVQYSRLWYYIPWVFDNNRKPPETLDEMTAYLRWIRDNDVNGNGNKNDEIGIGFDRSTVQNMVAFFAGSFMPFVYTGNYYGIGLQNKTVVEQYRDPRFRETLKYLAGLYKEGLMLADGFDLSADQLKSLTTAEAPLIAIHTGSWAHAYSTPGTERHISYVPIAPLKGPNGSRYTTFDEWYNYNPQYFITDKCKDPELAIALYDYLIGKDVAMDNLTGIGNWLKADPGSKGMDGSPNPYYRLLAGYGVQGKNVKWGQAAAPSIRNAAWFYGGHQVEGIEDVLNWINTGKRQYLQPALNNTDYLEAVLYNKAREFAVYQVPDASVIPPILMSETDVTRVADINAVLDPFLQTAMAEFIIGRRNIGADSDWNAYLAELDRIGTKEKAGILQKYIK